MACKANFAGSVSVIMPDWMRPPTFSGNLFALLYLSLLAEMPIGVCDGGVSLLTVRRNCVYMPFHGQTQSTGSQGRSAAATRMSESPSREGGRSAFCGIGFLRLPRSGSGEVRDGPASEGRGANRQRQRGCLRFFTPVVLSGAKRAGIWGPGGAGAAEARAAARAQTGCGCDGFSGATAIGRFVLEGRGTGPPDRRPLWAKGPSSQHRTRFDAAGKKTALIDTDSATLREAYEQLRRHVLTALPGGGRFGLAVLLREGVAAWIECRVFAKHQRDIARQHAVLCRASEASGCHHSHHNRGASPSVRRNAHGTGTA